MNTVKLFKNITNLILFGGATYLMYYWYNWRLFVVLVIWGLAMNLGGKNGTRR